jgi:hypothetical protein
MKDSRIVTFKIEALEDMDELDPQDVDAFRCWLEDALSSADFLMRVADDGVEIEEPDPGEDDNEQERTYEMCAEPGCWHFVAPNDADDPPGITRAKYVHLDDGAKDHDHDARPTGYPRTLAWWRAVRPELFTEYGDRKTGPNSALFNPKAEGATMPRPSPSAFPSEPEYG